MPFAGIAFLWFIGVVRDGFGRYEDKFFSSVFIGSGSAVPGDDVRRGRGRRGTGRQQRFAHSDAGAHAEVVAFGQVLMMTLTKTYALRMAAVFMISLATIWLKTGLMPRWLVVSTYLVAVALLIASDISMWIALAFPAWVLVVSLLVLVRAGVIDLHTTTTTSGGQIRQSTDRRADVLTGLARAWSSSASGTSSASTTTMPSSSWSNTTSAVITQLPALMHTSRSAPTFTRRPPHTSSPPSDRRP